MIIMLILVLILAVFVLFVWTLWKRKQEIMAGFAVRDERTVRIEGKAARITVIASGYFLLVLLYYVFISENFELGLPTLETGWALILAVLFNSGLYLGLRWYFGRKGD
jgi:uncharacterized membrane protein